MCNDAKWFYEAEHRRIDEFSTDEFSSFSKRFIDFYICIYCICISIFGPGVEKPPLGPKSKWSVMSSHAIGALRRKVPVKSSGRLPVEPNPNKAFCLGERGGGGANSHC